MNNTSKINRICIVIDEISYLKVTRDHLTKVFYGTGKN
jgi:hypothetical protein